MLKSDIVIWMNKNPIPQDRWDRINWKDDEPETKEEITPKIVKIESDDAQEC